MSAIAGVFAAGSGAPEREAAVARMLAAAPHRAGLAPFTWSRGPITLGCRAAFAAEFPFAEFDDGSAIVFDGRLDDRDDLARELSLDPRASSARLALAACVRWGERAPARLLGDFAFAAWDARRDRLLAARDWLGQRPLFHASAAGATLVASEARQLLAHPGVPARINEGAIAEFLAARPSTVEETVWQDVARLRPAHVLIAAAGRTAITRYWDFDPDARLSYARDEEYAEHFAALLGTAIECRTRDARGVGVFLSGGLDSSAIAAVAQAQARASGAPPVRAYSLTFPGLPLDESPYIEAVARQWDLSSVRLPSAAPSRADIEAEIDRHRDLPAYPNGAILDPLRRRAAADVDVVLTGYGGDDWFTGSPLHTADLLREGRLVAAAGQLGHDKRLPGRGYSAAALLRTAIAPLLSPRARAWLRPIAGARRAGLPWIRREFAARVDLDARLRRPPRGPFATLVQAEVHQMINGLGQILGDELEDRAAAAAGIRQRHPFNDRRLAAFGFALPEAQRWSGGETKVVLRRALGARLPELVRNRNDKAEFTPTLVQAIEGLGGRGFLADLRTIEAGWVDGPAIQGAYDQMARLYSRGDEAYIRLADAVWSVAAVELWLSRHSKEQP